MLVVSVHSNSTDYNITQDKMDNLINPSPFSLFLYAQLALLLLLHPRHSEILSLEISQEEYHERPRP